MRISSILLISLLTFTAATDLPAARDVGRVLCIGDSITEGDANRPVGEGNWSWRYLCWQNFVDFGVNHEFVGTRTANHNGSSVYPTYFGQTFLNHHEAIWGTSLSERGFNAPTYLGALQSAGKTPDTGIIFCGGNDVPDDLSVSAATVRDLARSLVDRLQRDVGTAGNPNIRILLVSILPRFIGTTPSVRNPRYIEINALFEQLAAAETTATSQVLYLDVFALFDSPARFYDGVHPTGYGEQLLGNAIFAALVPDMPAVQLRLDSIDQGTQSVNFSVRAHGPRTVQIQSSTSLAPGSWTNLMPSSLNPGEWVPITYIHPSSLPSNWFFRVEGL